MPQGTAAASYDVKPEYARVFKIGQPADLIMLENGNPRTYRSQIQDITEKELVVSSPMYKGVSVHVSVGSELTVSIFEHGARYMASSRVLARIVSPVDIVKMVRPQQVRRVQLRSNFRLEVEIPECTLHIQPSSDATVSFEVPAHILNLSAGGARFKIEKKVPTSAVAPIVKYSLEFPLDFANPLHEELDKVEGVPEEEPLPPEIYSLPCRIIAVDEIGEGKSAFLVGRCSFVDPSVQVQDRMTRYINLCQIALKSRRFT